MEDCSKGPSGGYVTVYRGYSTAHALTGLKELNQYRCRLRSSNEVGTAGKWSNVITVATTSPPYSSKSLHKAVQQGDAELVVTILKSNSNCINVPNIMGFSPLMIASGSGKRDVVRVLLDMGADMSYQNSSGRTSLMEACFHGELECAQLLIEHGSSCLSRDFSGFSSLHYAVDGGNINMVNFVLNEGVPVDDLDASTLSGWTPLMRVATLGGDAAIARVLVERGADVNRRDSEGNTVLMLATLNNLDELVRVLLESNADPLAKTEHGKTAVDFAASFDRQIVYKLLRKRVEELSASK